MHFRSRSFRAHLVTRVSAAALIAAASSAALAGDGPCATTDTSTMTTNTSNIGGNASGGNSIACGPGAVATGPDSTSVGAFAGTGASTTSNTNQAFGAYAGQKVEGTGNNANGFNAGNNIKGLSNNASGTFAGNDVTGNTNNASGYGAGTGVKGDSNTATGVLAGRTVDGNSNSANGDTAGVSVKGSYNTANGASAGNMLKGSNNTASGYKAGTRVTGDNNNASGFLAGNNINGSDNISVGTRAGGGDLNPRLTASNTISIGTDAKATGNEGIAIGKGVTAVANQVALGNKSANYTLAGVNKATYATTNGLVTANAAGDLSVTRAPTLDSLTVNNKTKTKSLDVTEDANFASASTTPVGIDKTGNVTVGGGTKLNNDGTVTTGDRLTVTKGGATINGKTTLNGDVQIQGPSNGGAPVTVSAGGNRIQDVAEPILGSDAVNKAYVDRGFDALGKRVDNAEQGIAIAMAIQNPVFSGNDQFGISVNWGNFEGQSAIGVGMAGIVGRDLLGAREKTAITAGFGFAGAGNTSAGRVGVQFTW